MDTPKTCSIRFERARLALSFHSFDTPSKDPFTILAGGSVLIIVFLVHTSSAAFHSPLLRTLYLSRHSRSDKRTGAKIHEESEGEDMKRKSLKRTASPRGSVPPHAHVALRPPDRLPRSLPDPHPKERIPTVLAGAPSALAA